MPAISVKPISRRTFLRGTGVAARLAVAGGHADADRDVGWGRSFDSHRAPVRAAYLYFPNGAWMDGWIPKQTGKKYELPFSLTPRWSRCVTRWSRAERPGQAIQP